MKRMNNKKHTLVERILDDDNISDAIKYLQSKGDKEGPDGIKPSMLGEYWNDNKNSIVESIYNYKYEKSIGSIKRRTGLNNLSFLGNRPLRQGECCRCRL